MRCIAILIITALGACGSDSRPPPAPTASPLPTPAAPAELNDTEVQRWLTIQEQVLDRAGIPGTDPEHRKRHQAVREEILKKHGADVLGQAQVTVKINSALDLLQKRLPIPESMRANCEVVQRHRAQIEDYVAREQRAKMR